MRVLIVGRGGREHALAQKFQESSCVHKVYVSPGNPGMEDAGLTCVAAHSDQELVNFCLLEKISAVVLGPETAILSDLKAMLEAQNIFCLAPSAAVARLESSKEFCKEILVAAQLPTAAYQVATSEAQALHFLSQRDPAMSLVVKADGLAQGKGVAVCENVTEARKAVQQLGRDFGYPVLIEECLQGRELSAFALCQGEEFIILGTACDYKRIEPDPFSANTGGMGAYSPCDFLSEQDHQQIRHIFTQTLKTLKLRGLPYCGFLFAGLMKCEKGLYVLEFNVRMGDPETQALLPRLKMDWGEMLDKIQQNKLQDVVVAEEKKSVVHVVAVSQGYPSNQMSLGHVIDLPKQVPSNARLYFAGVRREGNSLLNAGGRVLGVSAMADNKHQAAEQAYAVLKQVHFDNMYYRQDIGS